MPHTALNLSKQFRRAADLIREAQALVITAGAGIGVDSGLPDFRGREGLWRAYPPLKKLGINLADTSNPRWFHKDPEFAWGFFGHRYSLYKRTEPHEGFQILKTWANRMHDGYFIFTSNVDGHFQKAGFDEEKIAECHGSINYMQCVDIGKSSEVWEFPENLKLEVDESTLRLKSPLPMGPPGASKPTLARPNILMFGDWDFIESRTNIQEQRYYSFRNTLLKEDGVNFVVIEIGAGSAVPTVRLESEGLVGPYSKGAIIRINIHEPQVNYDLRNISLPVGGLEALRKINDLL